MQKYPDGDARRVGAGYMSLQRETRERVERREHQNKQAKKAGFKSSAGMRQAQKLTLKAAPKHYWRTAQYKGNTRAREAKRLAERGESQVSGG